MAPRPDIQARKPWLLSFVATSLLFVVPTGVAMAALALGVPGPDGVVAASVGVLAVAAYLSAARRLGNRAAPAIDGDIMLWSLVRRALAERKIEEVVSEATTDRSGRRVFEGPVWPLRELALALDRKDRFTAGHCRRVESQASRLAIELDLDNDDIEDLRLAAALHDVGKIEVPDEILNKPGELTDEEFAVVRTHPSIGADMIGPAVNGRVMDAVLHHHERWDGYGYPDGVAGAEIPMFARAIAVVDAYDAMTSERPYRSAMSHRRAVRILVENAGSQFDPTMVEVFVGTLTRSTWSFGPIALGAFLDDLRRIVLRWREGLVAHGSQAVGAAAVAAMVGFSGVSTPGVTAPTPQAEASELRPGSEPITVGPVGRRPFTEKAPRTQEAKVLSVGTERESPERPDKGRGGNANEAKSGATGSSGTDAGTGSEPVVQGSEAGGTSHTPPQGDRGHTPPGDPQPQRGRDCSHPGKGAGKGMSKHCS